MTSQGKDPGQDQDPGPDPGCFGALFMYDKHFMFNARHHCFLMSEIEQIYKQL